MFNYLRPYARLPCPSPSSSVCSNLCPLSQWCNPTISSSIVLFSACSQSFPALRSFPMSWLFISSSQRFRDLASSSVFLMNIYEMLSSVPFNSNLESIRIIWCWSQAQSWSCIQKGEARLSHSQNRHITLWSVWICLPFQAVNSPCSLPFTYLVNVRTNHSVRQQQSYF